MESRKRKEEERTRPKRLLRLTSLLRADHNLGYLYRPRHRDSAPWRCA